MRWTIRLLGMVNVIILARLLAPEDFGLIAMSTIVIGLVTTLTDGSVDHVIARAKDPQKTDYDSAWTVQIAIGVVNAFFIIAISPVFVWMFNEPRLQTLFLIGAFAPVIIGLENIGTVDFRRSLNFRREYKYWVIKKIIKIGITIVLALTLRNYFALALAAPVSAVCVVLLSYKMSGYRPSFSLEKVSSVWDFSKWLIVLDTSRLFERRGDEFAAGIFGMADQVGHYSVASDLATMPTREIIEPLDRVILPAFAPHTDVREKLKPVLATSLSLVIAVSCATGLGMYLIADPFVRLFLGSQWIESIQFFEMIALSAVAGGIALGMRPIFLALGEERRLALTYLFSLIVFLPIFLYLAGAHSFLALAQARIALAIWLLVASFIFPVRSGLVDLRTLLIAASRPALASIVMIFTVRYVQTGELDGLFWILLRDVLAGAIAFTATLLLSWRIFSGKAGPEAMVYEHLRSRIVSRLGRKP